MTPETIALIAERVWKSNHNRDYALYRHLLRPYPYGTPERNAIEAKVREISAEYQEANPVR